MDENVPVRGKVQALAPPAVFRGAFLVVDQHLDARLAGEAFLCGLKPFPRFEQQVLIRIRRGPRALERHPPGVFADDRDIPYAHAQEHEREIVQRGLPGDVLPAGHGHDVVPEDLVGDVGPVGNGAEQRDQPAVKHRAVADVLKHVPVVVEGEHAVVDGAAQPHGRDVPDAPAVRFDVGVQGGAADFTAGDFPRRRAGRHAVRTPRAIVGGTAEKRSRVPRGNVLEFLHAVVNGGRRKELLQDRSQAKGEQVGAQFTIGGHEVPAAGAALAVDVVDTGAHKRLGDRLLHERPLLLDDQHRFEPAREIADGLPVDRVDHAQFQDRHAILQVQQPQRLHDIRVTLSGRHDTEGAVRIRVADRVDPVQPGILAGDIEAYRGQFFFEGDGLGGNDHLVKVLFEKQSVRTDGGKRDRGQVRIDLHGLCAVADGRDEFQSAQDARVPAERECVMPVGNDLGDRRRVEDGNARVAQGLFAAGGISGALRHVVVPGKEDHAAVPPRPRDVGQAELVQGPFYAVGLAVPEPVHAAFELAAVNRRRRGFLVDRRLVHERRPFLEQGRLLPDFEVEAAQGRSFVTGDETASHRTAGMEVAPLLVQQETDDGVNAGEKDRPAFLEVSVPQRGFLQGVGVQGRTCLVL